MAVARTMRFIFGSSTTPIRPNTQRDHVQTTSGLRGRGYTKIRHSEEIVLNRRGYISAVGSARQQVNCPTRGVDKNLSFQKYRGVDMQS